MERWRRLELVAGTQLIERYGGASGPSILDGRHAFGVFYQPRLGLRLGLEGGFGLPSTAVPQYEGKVSVGGFGVGKFSGYCSYAYWHFADRVNVHILAPAIGFAPTDQIQIDFHWWISRVVVAPNPDSSSPGASDTAHSVGLHGAWLATPTLTLGGDYVYGVQLDQNPVLYQLLRTRSHVFAAFADTRLTRGFGIRPIAGIERRETDVGTVSTIVSFELGAYERW